MTTKDENRKENEERSQRGEENRNRNMEESDK